MEAISPNCEVTESLIKEFSPGILTMIYGNASSGKTTSCLLASISAAKLGKVIYVDTENGFSPDRLRQLHGGDTSKILENIFLITPNSFQEQHDTILNLKQICESKKIKLVVVDSIGNHYRKFVNDSPKEANQMMAEEMATLVRITRDQEKVVIVTNQASSLVDSTSGIRMVGGKLMSKFCKNIIEFNRIDGIRYASLIKLSGNAPSNIQTKRFEIRERGLFLC